MVYSNKFVMCVLVNGRPQKELANGQVKLPFGTEYCLRFRNKNNRRAVVKIYIDGENVSGGGYVIDAHGHVDIKRHHDVDRAFKFVDLESDEAIEHGKNGPNPDKVKGTIEARFYLEKEVKFTPVQPIIHEEHHHHHHYPKPRPNPWPIRPYNPPIWYTNTGTGAPLDGGMKFTCGGGGTRSSAGPQMRSHSAKGMSAGNFAEMSCQAPQNESLSFNAGPELRDGATVEGGYTGQNFYTTYIDYEETYTTLKIFLQGYDEEEKPKKPKRAKKPRRTKKRKTNKDMRLDDLESENEELRKKIAEMENEKLKKELEELQKE